MNNIYTALGATVRHYRKGLGWTQEQLGERAGLHPSYIGQIERGTKKISLLTLQRLAKALKTGVCDLLHEKPLETPPTSWERRLLGMIKDRPEEHQKRACRILREALRPYTRRGN